MCSWIVRCQDEEGNPGWERVLAASKAKAAGSRPRDLNGARQAQLPGVLGRLPACAVGTYRAALPIGPQQGYAERRGLPRFVGRHFPTEARRKPRPAVGARAGERRRVFFLLVVA